MYSHAYTVHTVQYVVHFIPLNYYVLLGFTQLETECATSWSNVQKKKRKNLLELRKSGLSCKNNLFLFEPCFQTKIIIFSSVDLNTGAELHEFSGIDLSNNIEPEIYVDLGIQGFRVFHKT